MGSVTASGQTLENHDVNLLKVIDRAIRETNFTNKWRKNSAEQDERLKKKEKRKKKETNFEISDLNASIKNSQFEIRDKKTLILKKENG